VHRAIKLIDELILPVVVLVAARYLGVFVAQLGFSVNFSLGTVTDSFTLPFIHFAGPMGQFIANSLSWTFVTIVMAAYFGLVLFRSLHFHKDYLHPKHAKYVHNKRLEFLLIGKEDSFYQTLVWFGLSLAFIFLATLDLNSVRVSTAVYGLLVGVGLVLVITSLFNLLTRGKSKE